MADELGEMGFWAPEHFGGSPVSFYLYLEDVDATFAAMIADGSREVRPVVDQFYGDRSGSLIDPFGHSWTLATKVEQLTEEQLQRRFDEFMAKGGGCGQP